jgi:hydrogenase maturation protein HypF
MQIRNLIRVTGIVQGVGFRPFVYRLAKEYGLGGFVLNDGEGVFLEAEGEAEVLPQFCHALREQAPPAANVDQVLVTSVPPAGYVDFEIRASRETAAKVTRVSPDLAVCSECLKDIYDAAGRRYRYPFTNCTLCGPRFTIIRDIPYDRRQTTMSEFALCRTCLEEYEDPADRRFHAQPNACPACGPRLSLLTAQGTLLPARDAISETRRLLQQGSIVAIKGLGGYHLACDAANELAVMTLRNRKVREEKPFALMASSVAVVRTHARVSRGEVALLTGPEAPIVLLRRRGESHLPESIAPGQAHLGFFLPYTPIHHLLFQAANDAIERPEGQPPATPLNVLVMTSGNRSDEPIAYRDEDALERLAEIADYFLIHNRPIHLRCDDSVVRVAQRRPQILRRSRGYVPRVTRLPWVVPGHVLATGPLLKNTYALAKGFDCYVGPHVGDLENLETFRAFEEGIRHLGRLFDIHPTVAAYDLHPDYLSTRYALSLDVEEHVPCQHHEAHVASVIGENSIEGPVIGVAFDGTGYGTDGSIWGGEFFVVRDHVFTRAAHLRSVPLPGGDQVAREPWRSALSYLRLSQDEEDTALRTRLLSGVPRSRLALVERMLTRRLNSPLSSGAGRAFDAAASLILGKHRVAYEGQGPMELEQCAFSATKGAGLRPLPYQIAREEGAWVCDLAPAFAELARHLSSGAVSKPALAARFHRTMSALVVEVASDLAAGQRISDVCLSGGVFQNQLLLGQVGDGLRDRGLRVHRNRDLPPNDGGISFGQVVLASWRAFQGAGSPQEPGRKAARAVR